VSVNSHGFGAGGVGSHCAELRLNTAAKGRYGLVLPVLIPAYMIQLPDTPREELDPTAEISPPGMSGGSKFAVGMVDHFFDPQSYSSRSSVALTSVGSEYATSTIDEPVQAPCDA
jgi:hypothetical protein